MGGEEEGGRKGGRILITERIFYILFPLLINSLVDLNLTTWGMDNLHDASQGLRVRSMGSPREERLFKARIQEERDP